MPRNEKRPSHFPKAFFCPDCDEQLEEEIGYDHGQTSALIYTDKHGEAHEETYGSGANRPMRSLLVHLACDSCGEEFTWTTKTGIVSLSDMRD